MAKPTGVEEYLGALAPDRRAVMDELRATIRAAAPGATESIAYDMPALRSDGQFLVSYAAYKRHYSLFPASGTVVGALGDEVAPYLSGKGTIQFPASAPIPMALVRKVVSIRLAELASRG
ncbi:MAG TPA: DUF1801 domain-containing protein [Verrucomicrobiae bacterium]|nr:DUF1801 domain-containing protein [Verrucomicrobiae bacterium]